MALKLITDPDVLKQLNGDDNTTQGKRLRLVTDENLLRQLNEGNESGEGFSGIANDIIKSYHNIPEAASKLAGSIIPGAKNVANYAYEQEPVETFGNLGAGGVESLAGLLSGPQEGLRYLQDKFPALRTKGKKSQTIYEMLMDFEKNHGLQARNEEEGSVRNLGALLFGGKALSKMNPIAGIGSMMDEAAGRGGDPLHAGILGTLGHTLLKPGKAIAEAGAQAPKNIMEAIQNSPEKLMTGTASALNNVADIGTAAKIPGIPSMLELLSSYMKHKAVPPEEYAKRQLFADLTKEDLPQIEERAAAAKRLGLDYLTPAELTLSPFEARKQGAAGRTPAGEKLLFQKGRGRENSEGNAINKLLDTIYDAKELDPKKAASYKETMTADVPEDFIERQMKLPVVKAAIKKLESNPAYKQKLEKELGVELGEAKPTSFMYWNMVKRVLGDIEEKTKSKFGKATTESDVYTDTRKSMVNEMDAIKPEYEVARGIAERKFTRRELENVFDKKTMTFNNFDSFLKIKSKFDAVMNKLKAYPEAQQMLQDIKLLSGDMIPNNPSIRTSHQMEKTGMWNARNKFEAYQRELDKRHGQEHDVATVNLMTHPNLAQMIMEHLKKH